MTQAVDDGKWVVGIVEADGFVSSVRFDRQFDTPIPGFVKAVLIRVEIADPTEDGLPSVAELRLLRAMTDRMVESAGSKAVMVGTVIGKGEKLHVFYGSDVDWLSEWETFERALDGARRFDSKVTTDPGWASYKRMLPEAERADADRRVLEQLAHNGAHLDEPRVIDWSFRFFAAGDAHSAERVLLDHEYTVRVEAPEQGGDWRVVASLTDVASPRYIAHMSAMLHRFALDNGGIYDGWGAGVTP
jgi:hypothetical protein